MNHKTYQRIAIGILLLTMFLVLLASLQVVSANPSDFTARARTATATTTLIYPAAATSTLVYDMYNIAGDNQTNSNQSAFVTNSAQLNMQFTASSSASRICRRFLYSHDNVDYYPVFSATNANATSTFLSNSPAEACFNFASTSDAFVGSLTTGRYTETIPMLMRFVKVQFYIPTATKAGIYAEVAPSKEIK